MKAKDKVRRQKMLRRHYKYFLRAVRFMEAVDREDLTALLGFLVFILNYFNEEIFYNLKWSWQGKLRPLYTCTLDLSKRAEIILRKYKPHPSVKALTFSETDLTVGKFLPREMHWMRGVLPEKQRKDWDKWIESQPHAKQLMIFDIADEEDDATRAFMPPHLVARLKNYLDKAAKQ